MPESTYLSLFLIGLLGGTHCVGMCGGIVGALSMGGGYGHDIGTTVQVQINTFGVALQYRQRWQNARP